jgi:hypothetical protein
MLSEVCPQCMGRNVVPFQILYDLNGFLVQPPKLMWACLTPTCLHKWARQPLRRAA